MRTYPIIYNKQIGGEFLSNIDKIFLENNISRIDDVFNVVEYHGKLSPNSTKSESSNLIRIPSNIFLIISDCCGTMNATNKSYPFYDGIFLEDSLNLLTKSELLSKILNGKITIDNQNYHIIKPESQICNLNLNMSFDGITNGLHYKSFGENKQIDLIDDIQKKFKSVNKKSMIDKLRKIQLETNKKIFNGLIKAFQNDPSLYCTFERTHLFSKFYSIMRKHKFSKDTYLVDRFIEKISQIFTKLDVSSSFSTLIEQLHLEKLYQSQKIMDVSSFKIDQEIDFDKIKFPIDFLIMILCYYFYIFDININKEKTTLSDILEKIVPTIDSDKFRFVLLLSCQVSEGDFCLSRYCIGYTYSNTKLLSENEQIKGKIKDILTPFQFSQFNLTIDDFTNNFILFNKKINSNDNLAIVLEQIKQLKIKDKLTQLSNHELKILINLIYDLTTGISIQELSNECIIQKYSFDDFALYQLFIYNSNYKNVFFHIFSIIIEKCFNIKIEEIIENIKTFQKKKSSKFIKLINAININKFDIYNLVSLKNYLILNNNNIKDIKSLDEFKCMIDIYIYSAKDFVSIYKLSDIIKLNLEQLDQIIMYLIQLTYNMNLFQIQ